MEPDTNWLTTNLSEYDVDSVIMEFKCLRKTGKHNTGNEESIKWGIDVTYKRIRIYEDDEFNQIKRKIKISKICSIFINKNHNQAIFNTEKASSRIIVSSKVKLMVKTILALRSDDLSEITFYEVPVKDLAMYMDELDDPNEKWAVDLDNFRPSENMIGIDEDFFPLKIPALEISRSASRDEDSEGKVADNNGTSHKLTKATDSDDSNDTGIGGSEDSDIDNGTSRCMLTGEPISEFTLLKVIGKGAFGRVFLAKNKSGKVFAMKRIRKDKVLRLNCVENILLERKILWEVEHPLLLSIKHAFASKYRFYFFTDYVVGGDLMKQLNIRTMNISEIKFIASQLILALDSLHQQNIVHRDLKPENVLIDDEGYIKLADFGLAKDLSEQVGDEVWGTVEYMAPEVFSQSEGGYNYMIDWWMLGILMYELYHGKTPFHSLTKKGVLASITVRDPVFNWKSGDKNSKAFKDFKSVVTKLLRKDPNERLGHSKHNKGANKIKKSAFFKTVDWDKIMIRDYEAPFIPEIDIEKIRKYNMRKGCEIGIQRKNNPEFSKLAETDIPLKNKRHVHVWNKKNKE